VIVTDSDGLTDVADVTIEIEEANNAPILGTVASRSVAEGKPVVIAIPVTDPDLPTGTLAFSAIGLPPGLILDADDGVVRGTPSFEAAAGSPYRVLVTVADDGTPILTDSLSFWLTVHNTNRAPVFGAGLGTVAGREGSGLEFMVEAVDPDGDRLEYTAEDLPLGMAINPSTGEVSGAPALGSEGVHMVVVTVSDQYGGKASLTFRLEVAAGQAPSTTTTPPQTTEPAAGTRSTTTSTTPPPEPEQSEIAPPTSTSPPSTAGPTSSTLLDRGEASAAKTELVAASPTFAQERTEAPPALNPRQGVAVSFSAAVETLRTNLLGSALTGLVVAVLLLLGVDHREDEVAV
jgi:hypothetical protein